MRMNLAGAFRVWLTVVACGVVAFGLAQTNRPDILWMDSSTDVPMDLAISPANDLIATIDHTVKLWRLQDGSLIRSLPSVPWYDHLTGVAFSPDGTLLAVAWNRGTVQLWNVADGSLVRNLRVQPTGNIITFYQRVVFSRDGSLLAASGTDGVISQNITVWRVATGEQLMNLTLEVPTYIGIKELQISPDGTLIAAAMRDGSVHLCRIPTGELVCTISAHAHEANSVDFTPDGAFLLTAGLDGVIRLWRVADGSLQRVVASGHFARLSPDGTLVAVTTRGGHTEIRRFEDGALLATIPTGGRPVFSPDGRLLTIARLPLAPPLYTPVQVWRVPEGTVAHQLPWLELQRFAYSSDGTKLAVLQGTRHPGVPTGYRIVLRNAADGSLIRTLELGQEIDWMWMQFVPNHDLIVVRAQRWSAAEQRYSTELRFLHTSDGTVVRTIQDASQVSFSADGTLMVVVRQTSAGERVQLLRMSDGAIVRELLTTNSGEYVNTAVLSPDARLVAMQICRPIGPYNLQTSLQVRRVQDNAVVFALESTNQPVRLQFSADGTRLAAFGDTTRVWRTSDFAVLCAFQTPGGAHREDAAMSADGRLLAIYDMREHAIRLWRVDDGQLLQTRTDESRLVPHQLMFSPTGRQLAYLRSDDTLVVMRNSFVVEGDLNGDGCVNNADLLLVLFNFGNAGGTGDANGDGIVNNADLSIVLFNFGHGC